MRQKEQNKRKLRKIFNKNWIVPLLVFIASSAILTYVACEISGDDRERQYTKAELNAVSYSDRMIRDFTDGISVTKALEQVIISEKGQFNSFDEIAANLMTDSLQSIQLAPGGVVTQIYPEKGNEAGKIDLLHDEERGKIARYGRDNDMIIMQGPLKLKQGGIGIAVRNPVFLENPQGEEEFWGFTIVVMRVPEIFESSMDALHSFGYEYRLLKTKSPFEEKYQLVYSSDEEISNPVSYEFELGGCSWKLEVMPSAGWTKKWKTTLIIVFGIAIICLMTGLTIAILVLEKRRNIFKDLSFTDAMTGLLNRNGFDTQVKAYLKKHPEEPCVGIILDVDDFKFINDMYGHLCGDKTLREVAREIKYEFEDDAILGRYGGDEFSLLLKNCTAEEAAARIESFVSAPRKIFYEGKIHSYTLSIGYAQYPLDADNPSELIAAADMALYEVKLNSKHGCMAYDHSMQIKSREQLGFALKDISKNLPGAFLIYIADQQNDRILFANHELIKLAGCDDMEDFMEFTKGRFRNLIHPDEQKSVENSIWQQITTHQDGTNDYVRFRFATKDGDFRQVLDHGRIVDSIHYGKVFYVLIMDCELIQSYYE